MDFKWHNRRDINRLEWWSMETFLPPCFDYRVFCCCCYTYIYSDLSSSIMQNWFTEKKSFQIREKQVFCFLYIPPTAYFFNVCCSSMLYNPLILFYLPTFFYKRVSDEYNDYKNVGKKYIFGEVFLRIGLS